MAATNLDFALAYAAKGLPVIILHEIIDGKCSCEKPNCLSPGKHPRRRNGLQDATCDSATITEWWTRYPTANIGIRTGTVSNLWVLDNDLKNGGPATLEQLEREHGPLPPTVKTISGGGGGHRWFKKPKEPLTNRQNFAKGLDARCEDGYICVPPSNHQSGKRYSFVPGHALGEIELAEMPDWLIELAKPQPKDTAHDNAPDTVAVAPDLQGAIAAMRVCCASDKPENDGSKRLLTYVCRGREHGLSAEQTIQVVRMVAADKPFPKDWSDAEIIKRYADAGNMVEDGSAIRRSSLWQQEERTDAGNAKRFAKRYGDKIRWDESRKCWFVWNGKCWQKDNTCQVERSVKEFAQSLWDDASQIIANPNANSELKKAVVAFCKMSNSAGGIGNVVRLAKSEPGIAIAPKQFDTDQYLFNVANGTVDLRTGELKPPDPADLITRYVDTPYDVNATCPTLFLKFVNDIFDGNQNLVALLQRYFGYCLTGDVREQTLLILHGDGSNGKTVLVTIIQFIFGGYAGVAPEKLLAVKKWDAHPAEVAKLFGKRLIVAAETDKNTQLSEARVKLLTGSDRLSARGMNENWWDFDPTHKILLMTNHRPKVTGTDFAIWRRLKLLPFNVKFWRRSKGESGPAALEADETLIDKLKPEAPGILNWFVQGCLEWQKRGLEMPPEVLAATEEYRTSEDKLARFIKECCDVAPDAVELATEITNAYTEFTGKRIDDYQDFVGMMEAKGFKKDKPTSGEYRKKTVWHGLRLKVGVDNELLKV